MFHDYVNFLQFLYYKRDDNQVSLPVISWFMCLTQARNVTKSLDVLNVWIYRLVACRNDKKERESDIAIIDQ